MRTTADMGGTGYTGTVRIGNRKKLKKVGELEGFV